MSSIPIGFEVNAIFPYTCDPHFLYGHTHTHTHTFWFLVMRLKGEIILKILAKMVWVCIICY